MNCPICKRPTRRMIYRRTGKICPDCNNPNFIRDLVTDQLPVFNDPGAVYIREFYKQTYGFPPEPETK